MLRDRTSEWFVPKFGSRNFRVTIGLLFLPYTSIVTCFAAWGSLSGSFETERLIAVCVIYFLALGVSAHLLDAVGGKTKPWGDLPKRKLWTVSMIVLGIAFTIGMYLCLLGFAPAVRDRNLRRGFFLFAYNLELFGGKFHNNWSTIIAWAILPIFAGSVIQTNSISLEVITLCGISSVITYILITTSRKYKHLRRDNGSHSEIKRCETILKLLTIGVLVGTAVFLIVRF